MKATALEGMAATQHVRRVKSSTERLGINDVQDGNSYWSTEIGRLDSYIQFSFRAGDQERILGVQHVVLRRKK